MIEAVIFDLNGVLIDDLELHFSVWSKLLKPYTNLSLEEFNSWSGRSAENIFEIVQRKYGVQGNKEDFQKKKESDYLKIIDGAKIFPNVKTVLAQLKNLNFKLGVATSESRIIAKVLLVKFGLKSFFPVVVGREMVKKAKPDPDIFLLTAKLLGVKPEKSIVVEDAPNGIESAKTAGMEVVAINTSHTKDELQNADLLIEDLNEVVAYVRNCNK